LSFRSVIHEILISLGTFDGSLQSVLTPSANVPLPPAEIWLRPLVRPPENLWIPDQSIVVDMKEAVDLSLRSRVPTADPVHPDGQYWFQYEGRWSGDTKFIFFVGRRGKPTGAINVVSSASIPEICHISGTYIPSTKKVTNFSVGELIVQLACRAFRFQLHILREPKSADVV
jgi:hypothetical protein